jgi:hypothetical protein
MKARTVKFAVVIALAIVFSIFVLVVTGEPLGLKSEIVVLVVIWLAVEAIGRVFRAIVAAKGARRTELLIAVGTAVLLITAPVTFWLFRAPANSSAPMPTTGSPSSTPTTAPSPSPSWSPTTAPPSPSPPHVIPHSHFSPARSLLVRGDYEERGFGLYSYLLFGARPTVDTRRRYLELVRTIILRAERTTDMVAVGFSKRELNVFYFPVLRQPTRTATIDEVAEWIVTYYDYARARRILDMVALASHGGGPYLLASLTPLSHGIAGDIAILEDLTRATDETAPLWAGHFLDVSCYPQLWNRQSLMEAMLRIREYISLAAVAGQPVVRAVDIIVAWVKPTKGGVP